MDLIGTLLLISIILNLFLLVVFVIHRSSSNIPGGRIFAIINLDIVLWTAVMMVFRSPLATGALLLPTLRLLYATPIFMPALFFDFVLGFSKVLTATALKRVRIFLYLYTIIFAAVALFTDLIVWHPVTPLLGEKRFAFGGLYWLYNTHYLALFGAAFAVLIFAYRASRDDLFRKRAFVLSVGTILSVTIGLTGNLILPWLGIFDYDWVANAMSAAFVGTIMFAIAKYRLFNLKVLSAEFISVALVSSLLIEVFFSASSTEFLVKMLLLVLVAILSTFLIRSVYREVQQRELIEVQERELEAANRKQTNLLHFLSHEVKGYLTKSEAAFAAIDEGDFGPVSKDLKEMDEAALRETRKGVETVMDILSAGDLKKGTITFDMKPFDLSAEVSAAVEEARGDAQGKHLTLSYEAADAAPCMVHGDRAQIRKHVIDNLIGNAIAYTPAGTITVSLAREANVVRLSVADSGIGLSGEDKAQLFTEGGRGKESIKTNPHSTGYGLFIAKEIVEVHGGHMRAESEGRGKGSTFIVELPLVSIGKN